MLGKHPEIGRPVIDIPLGFRDWFILFGNSSYVVRYRFDGDLIAIPAVRHGKETGY